MERTKLLTFAVIGLLLLNLLTIGFLVLKPDQSSHYGPPGTPPRPDGPVNIIIERLHFDQDQQKAYKELIDQHQSQMRELNEQMAQLHRDYYRLLASDKPDSAQANALSRQIADNQKAQAEVNFRHFEQIKALCHPDQQAAFKQLVGDLARLFGRHQHPPHAGVDGPPEGHRDGPPQNFPPHP
ncbi:hypothetical protein GCM10028805_12940 [Spirosoma harenae]